MGETQNMLPALIRNKPFYPLTKEALQKEQVQIDDKALWSWSVTHDPHEPPALSMPQFLRTTKNGRWNKMRRSQDPSNFKIIFYREESEIW